MAQGHPKSRGVDCMVAIAHAKADWTLPVLRRFYYYTVRLAVTWVNRRSQKRSYNWEQFNRFLLFNPRPKPKIYHFYTLSKRRGCTPEVPDEGKLHVRFCEGAHSSLGAITPLGSVL